MKSLLLIISCVFVFSSCSKSNKDSGTAGDQKQQIEDAKAERARIAEKQRVEEELAQEKARAEEALRLAEKQEALRLKEELKLKKEEEARIEAELAEIKKQQDAQRRAWSRYVGTEYDELLLLDGRKLINAKVTEVRATRVTYTHSKGVANVDFKFLSAEIGKACRYDPKLAILAAEKEKQHQKILRNHIAAGAPAQSGKSATSKTTNRGSSRQNSKDAATNKDKPVRPRGKLTVRVVGTKNGNKTIEVRAIANVDGILYLNDYYWRRYYKYKVKAGEPYNHTWRNVGSKYEVKLVGSNGKTLDIESHNRKSGLGNSGGL